MPSPGLGPRVLVVEDNRDMRELTVVSLRLHGFDARGAGTLEGALRELEQYKFAAIVTNLHLENTGDGERLCASAARLGGGASLIFFSGDFEAQKIAESYQAHFIGKPARLVELADYLRRVTAAG